jgi:hypothetical protein
VLKLFSKFTSISFIKDPVVKKRELEKLMQEFSDYNKPRDISGLLGN